MYIELSGFPDPEVIVQSSRSPSGITVDWGLSQRHATFGFQETTSFLFEERSWYTRYETTYSLVTIYRKICIRGTLPNVGPPPVL